MQEPHQFSLKFATRLKNFNMINQLNMNYKHLALVLLLSEG